MAPKRAAQRQEVLSPNLPEVLIPPSDAKEEQKAAYWIELLDNPDELRKAIGTTEFFPLLREFPQSLWGDRLSIYVYRLPDDEGMMVKNEVGARKYIKPIIRQPIDEDWIANKHGGGKYLLYLKLDNKASVKETTVRIDGPPKLQPGQTVEMDGKPVPIGTPAVAAPAEPRTDIAAVIEASANANKQNTEMLTEGAKAAIQLVKDQASAAAKPDANSGLMDKILTAIVDRMMNPPPPPDPIAMLEKARTIFAPNPATEAPEPKDPPLTEAMELVEKMSGKPFSELVRGKASPVAQESGWAPFAPVISQFVTSLPTLMAEFRQTRQLEIQARNLAFQREVWLRTAQPGTPLPKELLETNPSPPPVNHQPQPAAAAQPAAPADPLNPMQLAQTIVQMVCHGFDSNPYNGGETAAAIAFSLGKQIEAAGLDELLTNPGQIDALVEGNPLLKQRSAHARWKQFQTDFMDYMMERFGVEGIDEETPQQVTGPQPVA